MSDREKIVTRSASVGKLKEMEEKLKSMTPADLATLYGDLEAGKDLTSEVTRKLRATEAQLASAREDWGRRENILESELVIAQEYKKEMKSGECELSALKDEIKRLQLEKRGSVENSDALKLEVTQEIIDLELKKVLLEKRLLEVETRTQSLEEGATGGQPAGLQNNR